MGPLMSRNLFAPSGLMFGALKRLIPSHSYATPPLSRLTWASLRRAPVLSSVSAPAPLALTHAPKGLSQKPPGLATLSTRLKPQALGFVQHKACRKGRSVRAGRECGRNMKPPPVT